MATISKGDGGLHLEDSLPPCWKEGSCCEATADPFPSLPQPTGPPPDGCAGRGFGSDLLPLAAGLSAAIQPSACDADSPHTHHSYLRCAPMVARRLIGSCDARYVFRRRRSRPSLAASASRSPSPRPRCLPRPRHRPRRRSRRRPHRRPRRLLVAFLRLLFAFCSPSVRVLVAFVSRYRRWMYKVSAHQPRRRRRPRRPYRRRQRPRRPRRHLSPPSSSAIPWTYLRMRYESGPTSHMSVYTCTQTVECTCLR